LGTPLFSCGWGSGCGLILLLQFLPYPQEPSHDASDRSGDQQPRLERAGTARGCLNLQAILWAISSLRISSTVNGTITFPVFRKNLSISVSASDVYANEIKKPFFCPARCNAAELADYLNFDTAAARTLD
jgi:hypothetical protein